MRVTDSDRIEAVGGDVEPVRFGSAGKQCGSTPEQFSNRIEATGTG